jgi:hypothetical protein
MKSQSRLKPGVSERSYGEWRLGQGTHHESQQFAFAVVSRDAVDVNGVARATTMYDEPFAVGPCTHRDGFHAAATFGGPVAGGVVKMQTPEAPGTVVSVPGAWGIQREFSAAVAAFQIGRCFSVILMRGIAEIGL